MRAVIYTRAFEPITVIEVPMDAWQSLQRGDHIRFHVTVPHQGLPLEALSDEEIKQAEVRHMTLVPNRLRFKASDVEGLLLTTEDEEVALIAGAGLLPGQRHTAETAARVMYAMGFKDGRKAARG